MSDRTLSSVEVLALMDAARADGSARRFAGPATIQVAKTGRHLPMPGYDPDPYVYAYDDCRAFLGPIVTATAHGVGWS